MNLRLRCPHRPAFVALFLSVIASFALAVPAQAAAPFTLGPGGSPRIAMAGTTAHVAWLRDVGGADNEIRYCRLPPGATACTASRTFPQEAFNSWARPFIFAGPGNRVVIVSGYCCDHVKAFISTDGGTTIPTEREIGDMVPGDFAGADLGQGPNDISIAVYPVGSGIVGLTKFVFVASTW